MKRCPICERTFDDSMKFCQTDGTPLIGMGETEPEDLMKTMVSSEPITPEPEFDSFKTLVGNPISGEEGANLAGNDDWVKTQILSKEEMEREMRARNLTDETADDISQSSPLEGTSRSWMDEPEDNSHGYTSTPSPLNENSSSEYGTLPTPFQEPVYDRQQDSFSQSAYGNQDQSYNSPYQQTEWTPPPAPVASWQNQNINANTPFQSPVVGQGDDKTLAIVSLVCGILSLTCCGAITGIAAVITGNMAKNNVDNNPQQYGGRGMALAGMIMGAISIVLTALWLIFVVIGGALN